MIRRGECSRICGGIPLSTDNYTNTTGDVENGRAFGPPTMHSIATVSVPPDLKFAYPRVGSLQETQWARGALPVASRSAYVPERLNR